jgi:hypothetical protein
VKKEKKRDILRKSQNHASFMTMIDTTETHVKKLSAWKSS